jgi:pSer/pThr/pTyr-binding forkhead associated (FHA) protein
MVYAISDSGGQKYQVGIMLRIGRNPANQIVLQDPGVSEFHATLSEYQGTLLLRDENSAGGTFVNQARIQGQVSVQAGNTITIGNSNFTVEQVPEQTFAAPPANRPAKKKRSGCAMWPLAIYIVLFVACLGVFSGAYYLYKAPKATQQKALTLIGQGPATIEIENLADDTVYVFATTNLKRTSGDDTTPDFLWELSSFGTNNNPDQKAGVYRIDFGTKSGDMDLGTCTFNLKSGEVYHFVILPDNILIDRTEYPPIIDRNPASVSDLLVSDSSLCKYTP